MTDVLIAVGLLLVAASATSVVFTREPGRQAIVLSGYGLALTVLFVLLQAPDVAMSQLAVGTAVLPLMVILAIARIDRQRERAEPDSRPDEERR